MYLQIWNFPCTYFILENNLQTKILQAGDEICGIEPNLILPIFKCTTFQLYNVNVSLGRNIFYTFLQTQQYSLHIRQAGEEICEIKYNLILPICKYRTFRLYILLSGKKYSLCYSAYLETRTFLVIGRTRWNTMLF